MRKKQFLISKHSSLHLLYLFLMSVIFLLVIYKSRIYLLLFTMLIIYQYFSTIRFKRILVYLFISIIPSLIYFFIKDFNFLHFFCDLINTKQGFSICNKMSEYLDKKYDQLTANFIKLMVLNIKLDESYDLYKKMINLSVVYLIVISGFHLMFIKKLTHLIFKKIPKFEYFFNLFLFLFYSFLLNFSFSVLRVFLNLITNKIIKNNNQYESTALAGLVNLLFIPSSCFSLSFDLSYICTFAVIFVITLQINNKILEKILINICAVIVSLPFVLSINKDISMLAILNSFVFGYFFCFIFVYFFLFGFIYFLLPIHYFLTSIVFLIVEGFNILNIKISLNFNNLYFSCSYYILIFLIIMNTYKKTNFQW